ncbi:hypothetical protein [Agromyces salentinus]|uniref:DUF222 domain-containing protein n=1 Tax=Agromyces salentinus TaxID=269421 RepID=A0ABN2MPC7_9MICO|nr:hypothetical protein [Agromyces salentinus]
MPAGQWARALPTVVATLTALPEGSVDPKILEQLEGAADILEEGGEVPAEEACAYFSRLLEFRGQPAGTTTAVSFIPDQASAVAISAQQCVDGTYASLTIGRPDAGEVPGLPEKAAIMLGQLG